MLPSDSKNAVRVIATQLFGRVFSRQINKNALPALVAVAAQDAARHHGEPENWRWYFPKDLLDAP